MMRKLGPVALMLLLACEGEKGKNELPANAAQFLATKYARIASKEAACFPWASPILFEKDVLAEGQALLKASDEGRLIYLPEKVSECFAAISAANCGLSVDETLIPACEAVFEGRLPEGSECYFDEECAGGRCMNWICPGRCAAYAQPGESCAMTQCDPASLTFCDDTEIRCLPRKAVGESCTFGSQCQPGLECEDGRCTLMVNAADEGERCGFCGPGLYCDLTQPLFLQGVCRGGQPPMVGDPCDIQNGCGQALVCAGLRAAAPTQQCVPWSDLGDPCTEVPAFQGVSGCRLGLTCHQGRCAAPPVRGECLVNELVKCHPSARCVEGQCVAPKVAGASCSSSSECEGECVEGQCAARLCWE